MNVSVTDNTREHVTVSMDTLRRFRDVIKHPSKIEELLWDYQRFIRLVYGGFPINLRYDPYMKTWECDIVRID